VGVNARSVVAGRVAVVGRGVREGLLLIVSAKVREQRREASVARTEEDSFS
jgi:hypothetical protein